MVYLLLAVSVLASLVLAYRLRIQTKNYNQAISKKKEFFIRVRHLETSLSLTEDDTEHRWAEVSRKLHDEVGADLSAIRLLLNSFGRNMYGPAFDLQLKMEKHLEKVIKDVRELSKNLHSPSLKEYGLAFAVGELCNYISHPSIVHVTFESVGENTRFNTRHELALFRAAQELLNNALKHSYGFQIDVTLTWQEKILYIDVKDNGKGFKVVGLEKWGGTGIKRIEHSLENIGAKLMFPPVKRGTHLRIKYSIQKYD